MGNIEMKTIILSLGLMAANTAAVKLDGIPKGALMQSQPSHWRKAWPEGDTDNADGDAEVLNMFLNKKKKEPKPKITYPWNYDEDVVETKNSLETAEGIVGTKLSPGSVKDGGLGMIFTYDNTKVQHERNSPYGPSEYNKMRDGNAALALELNGVDSKEMPRDKGFKYD